MSLFVDDPTPVSGAATGGWCAPPEALCVCGAPLHPWHACPVVMLPGPPLSMPDLVASRVGPRIGCPECGTILNAVAANCSGTWHAGNQPDDPTPTTGGPVDYQFPEGCTCHIREDEYGETFRAPPGGCRVHTPWAFPGYVLGEEPPSHPGSRALLGVVPDDAFDSEAPPCGEGCECRGAP